MSERGTPWSTSCLTSRLTACASAGLEVLRDASYTSLPLQQGQAVKCTGMLVICTDMFLMVFVHIPAICMEKACEPRRAHAKRHQPGLHPLGSA